MKLNIGCGRNAMLGWVNVDSVALPGVGIVTNLDVPHFEGRPLAGVDDNSVDEILCSHVLEHIVHPLPLMQELWRVAAPGALMTIRVPYGSSDDAWEDPTHVRAFFLQSFGYFSQPYFWRADYQYRGDWQPEKIVLDLASKEMIGIANLPEASQGQRDYLREALMDDIRQQRNVVSEMVATLRAVKPAREPLRELQVQPVIELI